MIRLLLACLISLGLTGQVLAQATAPAPGTGGDRSATGGAQTLEDILKRQRGEKVDNDFRRGATGDPNAAASIVNQLGTRGAASDPEVWRALRFGSADVKVSAGGPEARVLVQDGGMWWYSWRAGPLKHFAAYALLGMIGLLVLFYLVRGRIEIEGEKTGRKIVRFKAIERFGHWLLAGSFILLGITGLITLFGRTGLIPLIGKDAYASLALASKWIHNNVAWAFILGLVMVFVMWVVHNLPHPTDFKWLLKAGGLFSRHSHPPARKFNAGQKGIFWSVVILGSSISLTGLALLFPFELPMFAGTFETLNGFGVPGWLGMEPFPTQLSPQEEMQYAQLWHALVALALMAIIIAHIYIGSIGMEGAYDAMGSGEVEEQWAREHHSLWVQEVKQGRDGPVMAGARAEPKVPGRAGSTA
ncbi:MAG: formate dehydrogenase subunit gamma [Burkholderiaceae bacterium]